MIKRFLYLNGLAILAAVVNHARVWALVAMISWANLYRPVAVPNYDQIGSITYYILLFFEGAIGFAVPIFLFVSGFYIAIATGKNVSTISWKLVFTRIKFLVIPYLIWCLIIIIGRILLEGEKETISSYLISIMTGSIEGPYYFVPLLIQYYLLAPFIVRFAKSNWKLLLFSVAITQLFTQALLYFRVINIDLPFSQFYVLPIWLFPTRLFWFVFGIVVGFHLSSFKVIMDKYKWVFLMSTIVFLFISMYERQNIFKTGLTIPVETTVGSLYALSFIFAFLGFSKVHFPFTNQIEKFGISSFGLYLVHVPVQIYTSKFIYHFAPHLLAYQIIFFVFVAVVGMAIPLLLMEIARRSPISPYYKNIFG